MFPAGLNEVDAHVRCARWLIILSLFLGSAACFHAAKTSGTQSQESQRWYVAERDVPPLGLKYHSALVPFPKGEEMRKKFALVLTDNLAQDFDKVRQVFCQATVPVVQSLRNLQTALV
ncbi:MAG: hypothetical protein M3Q07_08485 [Pseudobdellovibrionaceae bacterium]|nr:hypothetical protein [Pseudobdellovibrionaceae bacterium]